MASLILTVVVQLVRSVLVLASSATHRRQLYQPLLCHQPTALIPVSQKSHTRALQITTQHHLLRLPHHLLRLHLHQPHLQLHPHRLHLVILETGTKSILEGPRNSKNRTTTPNRQYQLSRTLSPYLSHHHYITRDIRTPHPCTNITLRRHPLTPNTLAPHNQCTTLTLWATIISNNQYITMG